MNRKQYEECLRDYQKEWAKYNDLSSALKDLFEKIAGRLDIYPVVQGRAKSLESFEDKLSRKVKIDMLPPSRNILRALEEAFALLDAKWKMSSALLQFNEFLEQVKSALTSADPSDIRNLKSQLATIRSMIVNRKESGPAVAFLKDAIKELETWTSKRTCCHFDEVREIMDDLSGVRVIVHTKDEVKKIETFLCNELKSLFIVKNATKERPANSFGYLSRHLVVEVKEEACHDSNKCKIAGRDFSKSLAGFEGRKAEVQLRTLAQHVFAAVYRELGYKNEFRLPQKWEKEFATIAAFLESCDDRLLSIKDNIRSLESNFGQYLGTQQIDELAKRLEILFSLDDENPTVFHRLIKTYVALEKWDAIEKLYDKYGRSKLLDYPPVKRDIGMAICKKPLNAENDRLYAEGQKMIEEALGLDPDDIEAHCNLGGTHMRKAGWKYTLAVQREDCFAKARQCYLRALELDDAHPYALGNAIACEMMLEKDLSVLHRYKKSIKVAIKRCENQVEVETNLPWALFDLAMFNMYLGESKQSKEWFGKAIKRSLFSWMIDTGKARLSELNQTFPQEIRFAEALDNYKKKAMERKLELKNQ